MVWSDRAVRTHMRPPRGNHAIRLDFVAGWRQGPLMRRNSEVPSTPELLCADDWSDYALLDSGHGSKLERFGTFTFVRPEPQAMWAPRLSEKSWSASGNFVAPRGANENEDSGAGWKLGKDVPNSWPIRYDGLTFLARPTSFRHLGFFPEQAPHWNRCDALVRAFTAAHDRRPQILNLFAYSGVASLHAARAGADVTHVDASKKAIALAFENREVAGMSDAPVRFITDDATKFVEREARRGRRYDAVILDPPKYGRGPKGERWQVESDLMPLLESCRGLLSDTPLFMLLTIYAIRASSLAARYALGQAMNGAGGRLSSGELVIVEEQPDPRVISQANFARWEGAL